jgi:lipopolysaccharide/colanic/teichoic acid biosynthesis glycosyltransferase
MVPDAEVDGVRWADKDDKRITKIGKFLRRFQIDEWPQFWNILKGQMSFVGPRPEVKLLHDEFCEYVIGFEQRLLVKPGLTGWAQVNGGAALLPEEKIMFDIEYISKRSLWFDLKCLWRTIGVIWSPKGY